MAFRQEATPIPKSATLRTTDMPAIGIEPLEIGPSALEWAMDIFQYLNINEVPGNKQRVRKVKYQAAKGTIVDDLAFLATSFQTIGGNLTSTTTEIGAETWELDFGTLHQDIPSPMFRFFGSWLIYTRVLGLTIAYRDMKPQNRLIDPLTHQLKPCNYGRARMLVKGKATRSDMCSQFYRASDLKIGAIEYTTSLDRALAQMSAEMMKGAALSEG
ncbi:putative glycogen synthase kinase-3 homolog [Carya illinoinensis]|uniref:putative glycogen synthase kinase-3 homolog n=1 Tax=Carya illinoinensis TaxID=32201 RepID=UPI001C72844B|nr:putative glycogen synthase kinase-3 homolog [Carya illinoinensis]